MSRPDHRLLRAVRDGDADAVREALQAGADPELVADEASVLELASGRDDPTVVKMLLDAGAAPVRREGSYCLSIAARRGHHQTVQRLIEAGARIDTGVLSGAVDHPETLGVLLKRGAQPAASTFTAAVSAGRTESMRRLLETDPPVEVLEAALTQSAYDDRPKLAAQLVQAGALVTPAMLQIAAKRRHHETLKILFEAQETQAPG